MLWFLRMKRWVQRPPSMGAFKFVLAMLGICAVLYGVELIWGWPDALTIERVPRGVVP